MLKRILVALDPDADTPVALRYAADIARRHDAEVHGAALVHTGYPEGGGGIGSMYYAEKLRADRTEESRRQAQILIERFEAEMQSAGVRFGNFIQEGSPNERLVEDMNYFDLLVIGRDPHFVYSQPGKETRTLEHVVYESVAPTFVVGDDYQEIRHVTVAFDGSRPAARALHAFAELQPFGTALSVDVVTVYGEDQNRGQTLLDMAGAYLVAHGFSPKPVLLSGGDVRRRLTEHARDARTDLIVSGAHSVSKLRQMAFGSTTAALLEEFPARLFLDS